MGDRVLITGGAGFIGSHLADELLRQGHRVRALDCLSAQVHGAERRRPYYLADDVELLNGDIRDPEAVRTALRGVDVVFHFAAMVGVGQSMYRILDYTSTNVVGTAVLLDAMARGSAKRLVVASSMSVYGEGLYRAGDGSIVEDASRRRADLERGIWDPLGPDGQPLAPIATPEDKRPALESVYALSKFDQERLCLMLGRAYGIPAVSLRFFNVYGPRQALSNPYTGVLAIFAARLLNGAPPIVFEDGRQRRDFVSVHDVVRACTLAMGAEDAVWQALNVGSGESISISEVARCIARAVGRPHVRPEITGRWRAGDIRHCFADASAARRLLGWEPTVSFDRGLGELAAWLEGQAPDDRAALARAELEARGLTS